MGVGPGHGHPRTPGAQMVLHERHDTEHTTRQVESPPNRNCHEVGW